MKVLLSSFHLNGHTLGFHSETSMLELNQKFVYCKLDSESEWVTYEG